MIYAIFMAFVVLTLVAGWRRHASEVPLFILTIVLVAAHLAADMTTALTLSF